MLAFVAGNVAAPSAAFAQTVPGPTTTIVGTVVAQENGLSVAGASVVLYQGTTVVDKTNTNVDGQYTFAGKPAGIYSVEISATGYQGVRVDDVVSASGSTATLRTPLLRATTANVNALKVIGSTSATGRASSLASTTTIQHDIDPVQLQQQGFLKAADAIAQLPGVNLTGGPHTIGDDTSVDIRGMGAGEVRPLIDGHPIGPLGVLNQDYYNYVNSPFSLLNNIQVTVGSGASGLYGVDVIGGTIDFQTLNPTAQPHGELTQQWGQDGTLGTIVKTTGTVGRLGYALGHSVLGSYGDFSPGPIFQGARPNNNQNLPNGGACVASNDLTSCNTALNTYSVSANYKVLNDLAKLRYHFTPTTALTLTAYAGNTHQDSTGNGDNDNIPYATRLGQIQTLPQTCPGGYLVVTDSNPNACYTAQQWAAASYGPYGGGEDRNRGTSLQDFSALLTTQFGAHAVAISAFSDFYNYHKYSSGAAGLDPTGHFVVGTGTYSDNYLTHGFLISDDIATATNDFGFGYFVEHQKESGNNIAYDSTNNFLFFVPQS
ncbi:MAG TPA: carboxypeptidase regulatory-like domain-containing protein, partial [Candidatus Elarobacter sp.]